MHRLALGAARLGRMRPALSVVDLLAPGEEPEDDEAETRARLRADLFEAAKEGECDEVEELLESGALIDSVDGSGRTALMKAASYGHADVVALLIGQDASVAKRDAGGADAFLCVCRSRPSDLTLLLPSLPSLVFLSGSTRGLWPCTRLRRWACECEDEEVAVEAAEKIIAALPRAIDCKPRTDSNPSLYFAPHRLTPQPSIPPARAGSPTLPFPARIRLVLIQTQSVHAAPLTDQRDRIS